MDGLIRLYHAQGKAFGMPLEASFEILTLNGDRWELTMLAANKDDALETANELWKKPGTSGVRVVREVYDKGTGLSHGSIIREEVRGAKSGKKRVGSR